MPHATVYRAPSVPPHLRPAVADVWCARLEQSPDIDLDIDALRRLLSADEQARFEQFRRQRDALAFAYGRAMLRRILASYTGIPAERISFIYGPSGKPALARQNAGYDIRFNLSHSGGRVVCVVARGREIGIDIEQINPLLVSTAVAELFFSANENAWLRAAPAERAAETFFTCWTRKEAYVKASGIGAALLLPELDLPPAPAATLRLGASEWTLLSFAPAQGYVAAVAVEGSGVQMRLCEYRMQKAGLFEARGGSCGDRAIYIES